MMSKPVIRVEGITKYFTSTRALHNVTMEVYPGEIRGLIGENGSGKSTLSSIISGNLKADAGMMTFLGNPYSPKDSFEASEKGISMIIQEQGTISTISVGANIFAGREEKFVKHGLLDVNALNKEAKQLLLNIGVDNIEPGVIAGTLSFENRKLVEIARAFYKMPELFIVDETTTALPQRGRNILYSLIKKLKEANKTVLFISHDIEELISVCDSVTILRDGEFVTTLNKDEMDPHNMKSLMVGREVKDDYYRSDKKASYSSDEVVLEGKDISNKVLKHVNFKLRKGEILGMAGLSDCGMHDLGKVAFGRIKPNEGKVYCHGKELKDCQHAIRERVGYISKNRDSEALLASADVKDNEVIASFHDLEKYGFFIAPSSEKKLAKMWSDKLKIKMSGLNQKVSELSGGNKQKVVLAKWLCNKSEIFIMDCPTRGIDVGVKEVIYRLMEDLKKQGKSIIMISEELPEVIGMSDRIMVIKDGVVTHEFERSPELSESDVIHYMI